MEYIQIYQEQNQEWITVAEQLWEVKRKLKDLEKLESMLMDELKSQSADKDSRGGGFAFTSSVRKGSVDYGSIPELKSVNLESYRKSDVYIWKLSKE